MNCSTFDVYTAGYLAGTTEIDYAGIHIHI